jgi:hypothetical protein
MARAGDEIHNPVQQDRIIWRRTARETNGELLGADLIVSPRGGNPLHVHPLQEEHFRAVSGTFGVQVGDEQRWLGEGEEAQVSVELRPALNSEVYFETFYGLARDGRTDRNGLPNLLQQAVSLNGINRGEIYLASPPVPVQKAILAALAPVGRLLGYKDHYGEYSPAEDWKKADPPSARSVMARGAALVASLLAISLFLVRRARRPSAG